ncbi:9660_t:CDS:2 [Ambispora gerdemannii]|uniref:9660_t:CDS:1 n=1 Tax=Ambispora gerdemannii TaxID=144530 RepID=A0A9N9DTU0_9GLOM|nr:9660_t:CDS:2 [Ambispora gerdemannii]
MKLCSKCKCNRSNDQFIWDDMHHKTCRKCKESRERKDKENHDRKDAETMVLARVTHPANIIKSNIDASLDVSEDNHDVNESSQDISYLTEELPNIVIADDESKVEHVTRIEVDYVDVGNFIENELQELIVDEVADVAYNTRLLAEMTTRGNGRIEKIWEHSWPIHLHLLSVERDAEGKVQALKLGKIVVRVNTALNITTVDIYHGSLHPRPDLSIEMLNELREEIKKYSYLTVVELKNHLRRHGFDISKYSPKRIYFWKSMAGQRLYQRCDNHVESARKLLNEYYNHDFRCCLDIKDSETIAIGFTTPLLEEIKNQGIKITEIYIDATYKTARGCYELYEIRERVMILDNELRQEITVLGDFQSLMNELLKLISERNNLPLCLVLCVLDDRTEALDTDGAINRAAELNS